MRWMRVGVAAWSTAALLSVGAWATKGQDDPAGDGSPRTEGTSGVSDPAAFYYRFSSPYVRSSTTYGVEVVYEITNDSDSDKEVLIEWGTDGGGSAGITTGTIPPRQSAAFTTANSGEPIWPEYSGSVCFFRDSSAAFEGPAAIFTGPGQGAQKNMIVEGTMLFGIGTGTNGNAQTATDLKVFRTVAPNGVDVSRFKGD